MMKTIYCGIGAGSDQAGNSVVAARCNDACRHQRGRHPDYAVHAPVLLGLRDALWLTTVVTGWRGDENGLTVRKYPFHSLHRLIA
jgi:hypothetical protein